MLRNNNERIIGRMAGNALKKNRQRTVIMLLAVVLSSFLIFSAITLGTTYFQMEQQQNIRLSGADMDAMMYGVTQEQQALCEKNADIAAVGIAAVAGYAIAAAEDDTLDLGFIWADETYWKEMMAPARKWVKGTYPKKKYEVMVTEKALEECGLTRLEPGDSFEMTYGDERGIHTEDFTISGIWDGYGAKKVFYVSEAFYLQSGNKLENADSGRYYFQFRKKFMTKKQQEEFRESLHLHKQQTLLFEAGYREALTIACGIVGMIAVTCLCAYLLIYNILYLSVVRNVRYYGLLQTVGMTEKQRYRFVLKQAGFLGIAGMAGGILLGSAAAFGVIPSLAEALGGYRKTAGGVQVAFHPGALLLTVLITGGTLYIASRKPARMAARVSPVEALGYLGIPGSRRNSKTRRGGILWKMAIQQVFGDRKRYGIVVLSLSVSLSIFLCTETLMKSHSARMLAVNYMDRDFVIQNDVLRKDDGEWEEILTPSFLEGIEKNAGIREVHSLECARIVVPWELEVSDLWMRRFYETRMSVSYEEDLQEYKEHPENFASSLVGIDEAEFDYLNETLSSPADKKEFLEGRSCILFGAGLEFRSEELTGKKIVCAPYEERQDEMVYEIAGITQEQYYTGPLPGVTPTIIVSSRALENFTVSSFIYKTSILYQEEYDEAVEKEILTLIKENPHAEDLSFESKIEEKQEIEKTQGNMPAVGAGIVFILAFIGIMNYFNTVVGNVQSRQRELAVLESVGMTGRQRNTMFLIEGILYTAGSLAVTLTVGMAATYGLYQSMNYRGIPFAFPVHILVAAAALMLGICGGIPIVMYEKLEKKGTVAERIRL